MKCLFLGFYSISRVWFSIFQDLFAKKMSFSSSNIFYFKTIKNKQSGARDERKETNAALAAKEAEENSLKGKSIKSISLSLVAPPSEIGMFSVVSIGMKVVLTNGTVLKTKNLGGKTPYKDFKTSVTGGDFTGGDFKIANDSREIPNDKIKIQVWSKFDSKINIYPGLVLKKMLKSDFGIPCCP